MAATSHGRATLAGQALLGAKNAAIGDIIDSASYLTVNPTNPVGAGYQMDFLGTLAFDGLTAPFGGLAFKGLKGVGYVNGLNSITKYTKQGFNVTDPKYLNQEYNGMGHHYIGRRNKWVPDLYMESSLNVLKPKGISIGDFYELHYKVDTNFHGTRLPGGSKWSGRNLGFTKYNQFGRVWHGAPLPLKVTTGSGLVLGGTAIYNSFGEE